MANCRNTRSVEIGVSASRPWRHCTAVQVWLRSARSAANTTYELWQAAGRPPRGQRPSEDEDEDVADGIPRYAVNLPLSSTGGDVEAMAMYAAQGVGAIDAVSRQRRSSSASRPRCDRPRAPDTQPAPGRCVGAARRTKSQPGPHVRGATVRRDEEHQRSCYEAGFLAAIRRTRTAAPAGLSVIARSSSERGYRLTARPRPKRQSPDALGVVARSPSSTVT
jgi:hypothetical protein